MPNIKIIGLLVLENDIFKGFYPIYGHGGHLGYVTSAIYINIINLRSPFPRRLQIKKMALICQAVSEEMFEHC